MQTHGVEAVSVACDLALSEKVISKDAVLNILHRLCDEVEPEVIQTPVTLTLETEPAANCAQYDALLKEAKYAKP
jgi:hypothetical protein